MSYNVVFEEKGQDSEQALPTYYQVFPASGCASSSDVSERASQRSSQASSSQSCHQRCVDRQRLAATTTSFYQSTGHLPSSQATSLSMSRLDGFLSALYSYARGTGAMEPAFQPGGMLFPVAQLFSFRECPELEFFTGGLRAGSIYRQSIIDSMRAGTATSASDVCQQQQRAIERFRDVAPRDVIPPIGYEADAREGDLFGVQFRVAYQGFIEFIDEQAS